MACVQYLFTYCVVPWVADYLVLSDADTFFTDNHVVYSLTRRTTKKAASMCMCAKTDFGQIKSENSFPSAGLVVDMNVLVLDSVK